MKYIHKTGADHISSSEPYYLDGMRGSDNVIHDMPEWVHEDTVEPEMDPVEPEMDSRGVIITQEIITLPPEGTDGLYYVNNSV